MATLWVIAAIVAFCTLMVWILNPGPIVVVQITVPLIIVAVMTVAGLLDDED